VDLELDLRRPTPADHATVSGVMDEWWGREGISAIAQPLFFEHFASTSLLEEGDDGLRCFLIAFDSADEPATTYIHIVGVRPDLRGTRRGAALYRRAFEEATTRGRSTVRSITGLVNRGSIAFHRAMGFELVPGDATGDDGIPFHRDHGGPGTDHVLFCRRL
jgi:GNAT superfamily N-acetyltransferase